MYGSWNTVFRRKEIEMTQTFNNKYAHGNKVNGQTLAEQLAQQMIQISRWSGPASSMNATIACAVAWEVHYNPFVR